MSTTRYPVQIVAIGMIPYHNVRGSDFTLIDATWKTRGSNYNSMRHDPLTPSQRSERMSKIRCKDTKPELEVRRFVHAMGYRYRLRSKDIPGRPDLVFRDRKKVIFVHGCFWHQHGCRQYRMPKSRREFWLPKLKGNMSRDKKVINELQKSGWKYHIIWECQLKDKENIRDRVKHFLEET